MIWVFIPIYSYIIAQAGFVGLTMAFTIDEPVINKRFPLMRLPVEIRRRVYQQYFQGLLWYPDKILIPPNKDLNCRCLPLERRMCHRFDIELALTCKALKDEVLAAFFEAHMFQFACGCELSELHHTVCMDSSG